jgi:putative endonuclease
MNENAARRRQLGRQGEDLAATWYEKRGFEVVARNWSCRAGELDIVACKGSQYVFCEVKTRSSGAFGLPVEAVDARKQARLRRLAAIWLATVRESTARDAASPGGGGRHEGAELRSGSGGTQIAPGSQAHEGVPRGHFDLRFDVASVLAGVVEVTEEAF